MSKIPPSENLRKEIRAFLQDMSTVDRGAEALTQSVRLAIRLRVQESLEAEQEDFIGQRHDQRGVDALYTDYREMLEKNALDLVVVDPNRHPARRDLPGRGVRTKGVITEKPMALSLAEADRMAKTCARADVPLLCGEVSVNHPEFERTETLLDRAEPGNILSLDTNPPGGRHSPWIYLIDRPVE